MTSRTRSFLVLACVLGAFGFWQLAHRRAALEKIAPSDRLTRTAQTAPDSAEAAPDVRLLTNLTPLPAAVRPMNQSAAATAPESDVVEPAVDPRFPRRLRNTSKPIRELARSDSAILLRNALIDTASEVPLSLPPHLKTGEEPGSYVVQANGPITETFRAALADQGADIVSYIPNNAYLVRASAAAAHALRNSGSARAVIPFEPYFKIDPSLLELAAEHQPLPPRALLRVTLLPEDGPGARRALESIGANILAEARSPFGPQFVVDPPPGEVTALACLPEVQLVEPWVARLPMNDLTGVRMGVLWNTVDGGASTNLTLPLTGSNVCVNVNDSGVKTNHPDLMLGGQHRICGDTNAASLVDTNGHGTHVAGTIIGLGTSVTAGTNVYGSLSNAVFRGIAPAASLFVLPIDLDGGPTISDTYLQETAANTRYGTNHSLTNILISNNSWGYPGRFEYDSSAASYDAATRDALPYAPGPQALLFVFAAGNSGAGNDVGTGGEPGTITSPGTAKNVLTVGATELNRFVYLTNIVTNIIDVIDTNGEPITVTNVEAGQYTFPETDTDSQVAPFSSRGNVGIGFESEVGRFKPDVVAPGTFVYSTWIDDWPTNGLVTNRVVQTYAQQIAFPGETNTYVYTVAPNVVYLEIETLPNERTILPFSPLTIRARLNGADVTGQTNVVVTPLSEGTLTYTITTDESQAEAVDFDLRVTTLVENSLGIYLGPYTQSYTNSTPGARYRFNSGTSSSAAAVSGMLALLQELFEQHLETNASPALLKALIINGARSLGPEYSYGVKASYNYQGWGLANLTNTLPLAITNALSDTANWPVQWVDQSPTNAIATGQTHEYQIALPTNASPSTLRVTLVWTDPPGNPAAASKLVNDLDLEVQSGTNQIVYGNDFEPDYDFNTVHPVGTNAVTDAPRDTINNVENAFLSLPSNTNYTVRVIGRRVNVNAVTAHTNDIVQDYALVVSIDSTNRLELRPQPTNSAAFTTPPPDVLTNGLPRLHDRAGANSPLLEYPLGTQLQWHFYVFTNSPTPYDWYTNFGTNVAIALHTPLNLSVARNVEPDIDLYVSRDRRLLDLDPQAVAAADRSIQRGGSSETIMYTNAVVDPSEVFYIGVKSEDQMAAEYSIVALSTMEPFATIDEQGNHWLRGLPVPRPIADGSPVTPAYAQVYAFDPYPIDVNMVVVSNTLVHELLGDLLGALSHNTRGMVLNNHRSFGDVGGVYSMLYDDSGSGEFRDADTTDGPGSLDDFIGVEGSGSWMLTAIDNALGQTGYVQNLTIRLTPNLDLLAGAFVNLGANMWRFAHLDVPPGVSRMIVEVRSLSAGPLEVYVRRGARPTATRFDAHATMFPTGGDLSLGIEDDPPLRYGLYHFGFYNPTAADISFYVSVRFEYDVPGIFRSDSASTNIVALGDDVISVGTNALTSGLTISEIKVGVRLNHERASDLAVYLVTPRGERVLLSENRGGTNWQTWGGETLVSDFRHVALTYDQASRVAALYLDGERIQQKECVDLSDQLLTRGDLYLGWKLDGTNTPGRFPGYLDEIDVYRRALSASEIRGIYKFGPAGKPDDGLVSRWAMDELDGGITPDALTNNPAELFGAAEIDWPGQVAQSLHLPTNSNAGYARIPASLSLDVGTGTPGFTIDAWINPQDLSQERPILVWSPSTNQSGLELFLRPGALTNRPPGELVGRLVDSTGITNELVAGPDFQGAIRTNLWTTNLVFATFSDDTNVAHLPIKLAGLTNNGTAYLTNYVGPASDATNTFTNRLVSGFERVDATPTATFCGTSLPCDPRWLGDTNLDDGPTNGWWVLSNAVTVIQAPALAHTGTNLLALRGGHISRLFRTEPGKEYRLQFAHRRQPMPADMVAWWPGAGNLTDRVSGREGEEEGELRYTNAFVYDACADPGQGFLFMTNAGHIVIPHDPSLETTNQWTIEAWVNLSNALDLTNAPPLGGPVVIRQSLATNGLGNALVNYGLGVSPQGGVELWYNDPSVQGHPDSEDSLFELIRSREALRTERFHHVAGTFRQVSPDRTELRLYVDGALDRHVALPGSLANTIDLAQPDALSLLIATNAVGHPALGGLDGFNGIIDELSLYARALTADEIHAIYAMRRVGKAPPPGRARTRLTVGGADAAACACACDAWGTNWLSRSTRVFNSDSDQWQTNTITFLAAASHTRIDLEALAPGALIDSIEVIELRPRYFQPEESMSSLVGQLAVGDWRLEVVDRRTGATNDIDPELLTWQLDLQFGPPLYPILTLTNGVTYTNTLPRATRYFMVNVPEGTERVLNTLTNLAAAGIDLWFNAKGLPTGEPEYGDFRLLTNVVMGAPGYAIVATNGSWLTSSDLQATNHFAGAPRLEPGRTYYLGVRNDQATTAEFALRVDFFPNENREICPELDPLPLGGVSAVMPASDDLQYYCYTVPQGAACVRFHLEPLDGDLNLYIRNERSELPLRPQPDWFEYAANSPGTNAEVIVVNQRSCVPLFAGHWYLGIENREARSVQYRLWVEEQHAYTDTPLAADQPIIATARPGNDTCSYFVFSVTNAVPAVQFDLESFSNPSRLLVSRNSRPGPCDSLREDEAAPGLPTRILICTNDAVPDLRGDWYVAVINRAPTDTPFRLRAGYGLDLLPVLRAGVTITNTIGSTLEGGGCIPDAYRFTVVPNATRALFRLIPLNGDADLALRLGELPETWLFDYLGSTPGITPEFIEVETNSVPQPLVPGDWFVRVFNQTQSAVTYLLVAEQYAGDDPTGIFLDMPVIAPDGTVTLTWSTYPGLVFRLQYATTIPASGPIPWITIPIDLTSLTSFYSFVDDGAFTEPFTSFRIYRLVLVGP